MKLKELLILSVVLLLFLFGCTTSDNAVQYSPQEIEDARIGGYEVISLALKAATDNTADSLESLPVSSFFSESEYSIIEEHFDRPGVKRRLNIFTEMMTEKMKAVLIDSIEEHRKWITHIVIENPYDYVLGTNDSLTTLSAPSISEDLDTYIREQMNQDLLVFETYRKFLSIINTYILKYNENNPTQKKNTMSMWEPSAIISTVSQTLLENMKKQEQIIRSLAPSYESEYIRLYGLQ